MPGRGARLMPTSVARMQSRSSVSVSTATTPGRDTRRRSSDRARPRRRPSHNPCGRTAARPARLGRRGRRRAATALPPTFISSERKPCSSRKARSGSGGMPLHREVVERLGQRRGRRPAGPARGLRRALSAWSISDWRSLGFLIAVGARPAPLRGRHVRWISCAAVFGPTPGTPGTLSTLSPISASTSPSCSGGTPNFSSTSSRADAAVVHRVEQVEPAVLDQLHQILVGRDDRHLPALGQRGLGVAGDDVVRLQPLLLDARHREGARRVADHRELRHEILGRRRAVRLVLVVHVVAEGLATRHRRSPPDGSARRRVSRSSSSFHSIVVKP